MSPDPGPAGVRVSVAGPLARVTLDSPERRNAMTPATWLRLAEIGRSLPGDVRVVVLDAVGRSFSAGLDRSLLPDGADPGGLAALAGGEPQETDQLIAGFQQGFTWWHRPDLLSVAVVQGHAVGAGFQLALACDLRILTPDAVLAMREPALGLVPDLGGTGRLVRLVGESRALDICLTGRWVTADEALALGLANRVCAADQVETVVGELVTAVLAAPRQAIVETKALLTRASRGVAAGDLAAERAAQVRRLRDLSGRDE